MLLINIIFAVLAVVYVWVIIEALLEACLLPNLWCWW
jgi:hypothetical protein